MSDNVSAAYGAAESLISAGHKKIGLLLGPDSNYTPIERRSGFLAACAANNIELRGEYIRSGPYYIESGYRMTRELLALPEPPTAIFATNNELTIGALNALSESGLTLGRDISFNRIRLRAGRARRQSAADSSRTTGVRDRSRRGRHTAFADFRRDNAKQGDTHPDRASLGQIGVQSEKLSSSPTHIKFARQFSTFGIDKSYECVYNGFALID